MKQIGFVILGSLLLVSVSFAQMHGGPPPEGCAALAKFFNRDAAFTATAKVVIAAEEGAERAEKEKERQPNHGDALRCFRRQPAQ